MSTLPENRTTARGATTSADLLGHIRIGSAPYLYVPCGGCGEDHLDERDFLRTLPEALQWLTDSLGRRLHRGPDGELLCDGCRRIRYCREHGHRWSAWKHCPCHGHRRRATRPCTGRHRSCLHCQARESADPTTDRADA